MTRASLLHKVIGLIYFIFALNTLALVFSLYYTWFWFDIPMHFLGGLWVALALGWLFYFSGYISKLTQRPFVLIVLGTVIVGGLWEVFEFVVGARLEEGYVFDTSLDMVMDTLGALCGFVYLKKYISHE